MNTQVITIARQYGSGGHEIGKRLATLLNYKFYDKEIINRIAASTGLHPNYIKAHDEIKTYSPALRSGGRYLGIFYHMAPGDQIFIKTMKIMRNLASESSCIIVGRCADYILDDTNSLNIYFHAPLKSVLKENLRF